MNVLDSSAWLEIFADGPNAEAFSAPLDDLDELVVPVITVYEVFKHVLREIGESAALEAVAMMRQGEVVDLDSTTALRGAKLSLDHSLPMADALILATALDHGATLWTQDRDFAGMEGVRYFEKVVE